MEKVTIGPDFFKKEFNEYQNWEEAWVREVFQNSADAGAKNIIFRQPESKIIEVENDGEVMNRDILVDKLLSLRSSGKDFKDTVGGFGAAKNIILFAHEGYQIHTGNLLVKGRGGDYTIEETEFFDGTKTRIWIDDEHSISLKNQVEDFAKKLTWGGDLFFEDDLITDRIKVIRKIGDYKWGEVFIQEGAYSALVRIGGLPMFTTFLMSEDYAICVDLKGKSCECLTANRDGLKWDVENELRTLIQRLAYEKEDNFEVAEPEWIVYGAPEQKVEKEEREVEFPEYTLAEAEAQEKIFNEKIKVELVAAKAAPENLVAVGLAADVIPQHPIVPKWRTEAAKLFPYFIKNQLKYKVPTYFLQETISSYGLWLLKTWENAVKEMYQKLGKAGKFSIGFVMSQKVEAQCEQTKEYGLIYLLNPIKVGESGVTLRYLQSDVAKIRATAAHEVAHGAFDCFHHNERYAGHLTDVLEAILRHAD